MLYLSNVSCLEKILPNSSIKNRITKGTTLNSKTFSFQVAVYSDSIPVFPFTLKISGAPCKIYKEKYIPAVHTCTPLHDDYIIDEKANLFPDALIPYNGENFIVPSTANVVFYVEFEKNTLQVGEHEVLIELLNEAKPEWNITSTFNLSVLNGNLVENDLMVTRWFSYDCLCETLNIQPFTDEFYSAVENYVSFATERGQTMVFVPLFTPPLDTAIGTYRRTIQSVDVKVLSDNKYQFSFEKFDKLIAVMKKCGVNYFEFSHLFSQWGASNCPKIVTENEKGEEEIIFGWNDSSEGEKYNSFLKQFLSELSKRVEKLGIAGKTYIHISDEPDENALDRYIRLHSLVKEYAPSIITIDALSSYEFAKNGAPNIPVVQLGSEKQFIDNNKDFWIYYACETYKNHYSNIFFNMPLLRVRILGTLMYLNNVKGFLHWGYNYYKTVLSYYPVNPYESGDMDGFFPAGDSFVVYPDGKNGLYSSLRLEAFSFGIQDYCALKTLEEKIGRDKVVKIANKYGYYNNFSNYNTNDTNFMAFMEEIIKSIAE